MSAQWGLWEFDEGKRSEAFLAQVPSCLQQWGSDRYGCWETDYLIIGAQSFHITLEDLRQEQPLVSSTSGNVLTFDGRLDNRTELLLELDLEKTRQETIQQGNWNPGDICEPGISYLNDRGAICSGSALRQADWLVAGSESPTDLEIVAAAFDKWNTQCFTRMRGDWAIAVWEKAANAVHFSRDPFGPRHLFYSANSKYVCWSSRHECLSRLATTKEFLNAPLKKDQLYSAASVLALAALDATPYQEIRAVPPGHVVSFDRNGKASIKRVAAPTAFRPDRSISFQEARDTFRHLLERSLIYRMRSAFPVTLELSGGCDSSTLVCLTAHLHRQGKISAEWQTVTRWPYKDDKSQDAHYAGIAEESIGRRGHRVCTFRVDESEESTPPSAEELAAFDADSNARLEHSPSQAMRALWDYRAHYSDIITEHSGRVLICGLGGDELAGGVQDAAVGLSDEWVGQSLSSFAKSLMTWARYKNETVWRLLLQVAAENLPAGIAAIFDGPARRQARVMRLRFPEFSIWRLAMIRFVFYGSAKPLRSRRRQTNDAWPLSLELSHKKRLCHIGSWRRAFPFVSQDWVEALAVLPPEYLQAPFQRRRLLRDAFADIVPSPILWRRTKDFGAFMVRTAGEIGHKRLLKDFEEHAQVLQMLQSSQQSSASTQADSCVGQETLQIEQAEVHNGDHLQYQPAPHIRFTLENAGATLLDISRGKRVVLNPTAAFIWRGIVDKKSGVQISRELASNFQISHSMALTDTRELIGSLTRNNILVSASSGEVASGISTQK